MIDTEVVRLRLLRAHALKVRAVARALASTPTLRDEPLLRHAQCASWRIVRAVSGRLRAHPYAPFQRDPGLATVFANSIAGVCAALAARHRARAWERFGRRVQALGRELDDARALTWAADLSDSLGRSQAEIRLLLSSLPRHQALHGSVAAGSLSDSASLSADWPYLAL